MAPAPAHSLAQDKQSLLISSALQGQQALSLFALPLIALRLRTSRPFSLTRLLREYSLSSLLVGPAIGAGYAVARMQTLGEGEVQQWAGEVRVDRGKRRREDYGVVGGWVGALALPALLLKRAPLLALLTSGYSLGTASGVLWHYASGPDTPSLEGVPDAPVSGVGKGALGGV
ncbi:hypothetical protein JCM10450v2_008374 [Rhodotorula kratochvilovae]